MNETTDQGYKVHENRLRRMAVRQGLSLEKSRTRMVEAPDFGLYRVVDPYTNSVVAGGTPFGYSMSLSEVEEFLRDE